jgi:hypothetical protein
VLAFSLGRRNTGSKGRTSEPVPPLDENADGRHRLDDEYSSHFGSLFGEALRRWGKPQIILERPVVSSTFGSPVASLSGLGLSALFVRAYILNIISDYMLLMSTWLPGPFGGGVSTVLGVKRPSSGWPVP